MKTFIFYFYYINKIFDEEVKQNQAHNRAQWAKYAKIKENVREFYVSLKRQKSHPCTLQSLDSLKKKKKAIRQLRKILETLLTVA